MLVVKASICRLCLVSVLCFAGGWGWLWVLCKAAVGHSVLSAKLLRGVWQRRWNDECGWVTHVLFSGVLSSTHTHTQIHTCIVLSQYIHTLSFLSQILKPSEKKAKYQYSGVNSGRPVTPPRTAQAPKKRWAARHPEPHPSPPHLQQTTPYLGQLYLPNPLWNLSIRSAKPLSLFLKFVYRNFAVTSRILFSFALLVCLLVF